MKKADINSSEEQKQGFCLTDYLTDVFNCKHELRSGVRIKPIIFKLAKGSRERSPGSHRRNEKSIHNPRKGSCPEIVEHRSVSKSRHIKASKSCKNVLGTMVLFQSAKLIERWRTDSGRTHRSQKYCCQSYVRSKCEKRNRTFCKIHERPV